MCAQSQYRFTGTFFDFQHINQWDAAWWCDECRFWREESWRELVKEMKIAGFDTAIATGTAFWGRPFFDGYEKTVGRKLKMGCSDPIAAVMDEADKQGMRIFLGLGFRGRIGEVTDYQAMRKPWTPAWFEWDKNLAEALLEKYSSHQSFAGFYIGCEINMDDEDQVELYEILIKKYLRPIIGDTPVAASPSLYGNQLSPAGTLAKLPKNILRTGLDIIAPQDMGGRAWHQIPVLEVVQQTADGIALAKEKLRDLPIEMWINCEVFSPERSPDGRINCVPGDFERIKEQIKICAPVADKLICYQFQGIMNRHTPLVNIGSPGTDELYRQYMDNFVHRVCN